MADSAEGAGAPTAREPLPSGAEPVDDGAGGAPDWQRKYPPLLALVLALVITLAVLPSALNLPQSNPTETLEYAPVPPDENDDTPPDGNFNALGLGESSSVQGGGAAGGRGPGAPPPPAPVLEGRPIDPGVQCVILPGEKQPRQTRDPLSPPCVPLFEGDNYGVTYGRGVTGEEIRVLIYLDGNINYINGSDTGSTGAPSTEYFDLFKEPEKREHLVVRSLRTWQTYFNQRFQTYDRRVHFWVYFSNANTPEARRADAADNLEVVDPFAVISLAQGHEDAYLKSMALKGVLNFGTYSLRPAEFYSTFPKLIWSYLPSIEQQLTGYAGYVCRQVVGRDPSLAAPDLQQRARIENGGKRRIGIIHTTDPGHPGLVRMAELVKQEVARCGGEIEAEATFAGCCLAQNNTSGGYERAARHMAEFKQAGITTILWPGGISGDYGRAAVNSGYFPEWIVLGDTIMDAKHPIRLSQNSGAFDGRAIVVTPQAYEPGLHQQLCYQAFREIDNDTSDADLIYTCGYYRHLFQLFTGIQVAGPRLGPTSIDEGFHAIPQRYYGDPQVPACFYLPGDYTCVKDQTALIWRAGKRAPGDQQPGCWAAIEGGRRYAGSAWPEENIDARLTGNEPCSGYDNRVRFRI